MHTQTLLRETDHLPWQELRPGFHLRVLHGATDEDTRALLLKLEPGVVVGRHRHGGEVHALTLQGQRRLLDSGQVVGAGGYVYEPPGNEDSWMAIGDEPLVLFVTVRGPIEALDERGEVTARTTTGSIASSYRDFLATLAATA